MSTHKLAIIISHPIQHFCPQYASLAAHPDLTVKVFFASALGYKKYLDPNFKKEIAWGNLRLEAFDHVFLNGGEALPADKELDAPELDAALTAFAPDVVLVHGYFQPFQRRAYQWARKQGVPMAYISDSERRQKRSGLKEMLKYFYLRLFFSRIDCFLSVGDANEEYYRFYGVARRKIVRMHFSIDLPAYREAYRCREALAAAVRTKFGLSPSDLVLSVVGKLVPWKNQGDILEAMRLLEAEGVTLTLFVIGTGEQQALLADKARTLKKSRVLFPGFVPPEDLPGFYAATDIYVHPSAIEPHSLAISEAIYMGCPAIISDRCGSYGSDDDVQEGSNGFVFRCGDARHLAEKIGLLARDAEKRRRFGVFSHELGVRFQQRSHGGFVPEMREKIKK
jgi:glycosyltransferase involved in cell wall biosynthesis